MKASFFQVMPQLVLEQINDHDTDHGMIFDTKESFIYDFNQ